MDKEQDAVDKANEGAPAPADRNLHQKLGEAVREATEGAPATEVKNVKIYAAHDVSEKILNSMDPDRLEQYPKAKSEALSEYKEELRIERLEREQRMAARLAARLYSEVRYPSAVDVAAKLLDGVGGLFSRAGRMEPKKPVEVQKTELVKELLKADIDPLLFDALLSNEMNRRLKLKFGFAFTVLTVLFTIASYLIVVLNATNRWGISSVAITGLIIETPLQFVGLLYIIARNLFPSVTPTENVRMFPRPKKKTPRLHEAA